jgi:hypothetical protein
MKNITLLTTAAVLNLVSGADLEATTGNSYPIAVFPGFDSNCWYNDFRIDDIKRTTGSEVICIDTSTFK